MLKEEEMMASMVMSAGNNFRLGMGPLRKVLMPQGPIDTMPPQQSSTGGFDVPPPQFVSF